MSKNLFVGVDGKARKAKEFYVGVNGKAHRIVKAYIGDENGKARPFWEKETNIAENSLEFVSDNSFTMNTNKLWNGTIEYNNGNGNGWTTWDGSEISSSNIDGRQRIYFRGSNNTYIMGSNGSRDNAWKITGSNVECNGNLWNILDYNTVKQDKIPTHASRCFYHMFDSCEALIKVPALGTKFTGPVTSDHTFEAPEYCYAYMFYGCSNILEPAELISHKMGSYCYLAMYQNCVKLTRSANLDFPKPRTLPDAEYCYSNMFYGCSSLEEVKNLGRQTGVYLYYRTFSHCNSIRTIPDIIQYQSGEGGYATWSTYREAFSYCLGLRRYPTITTNNTFSDLRTSYENHFHKMFLGCPLPIYNSSSSGRIPYIIPEDKKAKPGTINSFWGEESSKNNITLNTTYYIKDPDITPISIPTQYLTFSSENPFSIRSKGIEGKIFYSVDKTNWYCWVGEMEPAKINQNTEKYEIYFAGESNLRLFDTIWENGDDRGFIIISNTNDVRCDGNINTLLNHRKVENNEEISYLSNTFSGLFCNCNALISAPSLPNTALEECCYQGMFHGCSNLKEAPVLPATTLAGRCYEDMFCGSGITSAPILPATTLATDCYKTMFRNCSKLTTAPVLPATTLATGCYRNMFYGSSLTTAPALPITTLAERCYEGMFSYCSSLTTAPALPATTLVDFCYEGMFSHCSSLTTAPALPATTLAYACYSNMFYGCVNLIRIPALNATTLVDYCYAAMFASCPKVRVATKQSNDYPTAYRIPTNGTAASQPSHSMNNMFSNETEAGTYFYINTTYYLPKGASIIS